MTARGASERLSIAASIADLDVELQAGELSSEDHERLRESYLRRMSELLKSEDHDDGRPSSADAAPSASVESPRPVSSSRKRNRIRNRRLLYAAAACLVIGAAVLAVSLAGVFSSTRLPGESASGSIDLSSTQGLRRALQQAQTLETQGNYAEALGVYGSILKKYPAQPEALAYSGWILQLAGQSSGNDAKVLAEARMDEEAAIASAPGYADAHYFLGAIDYEDYSDAKSAVSEFKVFLGDHPSSAFLKAARPVMEQAFAAAGEPLPAGLG